MRRGLVRIVTVGALAATLAGVVSTPASGARVMRRDRMLAWVNHARAEHGLRKLTMAPRVIELARDHNLAMARRRALFHTEDLGAKLRSVGWHAWGENVGAGVEAYRLYKAYMGSPAHRANMLGRGFDHVGISFVERHGILWSTLIFYG